MGFLDKSGTAYLWDKAKTTFADKTESMVCVTPQMYGAVGDGVKDDTQAIRNALKASDYVYLPKGTYLVTGSLDLSNKKSLFSHNQEGVIYYTGSGSVFHLGQYTRINGIKVTLSSANVENVFNTDNRIFPSTTGSLCTEVDDVEVYIRGVVDSFDTTIINIVASNKDYIGVSGFHNQHYSNIRVTGYTKVAYGIKICVSFDDYYEAGVSGALPWITNMRFNHIWLGSPKCGIKIYRANNSGQDIAYSSIVTTEHMMFTDVATQYASGHCEKFYEVEWTMAEFINCQPWDYHNVTNAGKKYNTIGAGAKLSEVNARRSPIEVAEFPSVTATTPEADPAYFMRTFFNFHSNIDGHYDYIEMKCEDKVNEMGVNEVVVEGIAQRVVEESLTGIYTNVMTNSLTEVRVNQRYSNSSKAWTTVTDNDALIIPIKSGTNLIRWRGNDLSPAYMAVFLSNDLVSCVQNSPAEWDDFIVTTEGGDTYLPINNSAVYKYCILPFKHTEVTMNANNMIVTINEVIGSGAMAHIGEHINNPSIHVTAEEKATWNNIATTTPPRGTGTIKVTTAPSSYTTAIGSYTPKYRIALSTVKTQGGVNEVLIGDIISYSYYHYQVDYLDDSYAYISKTRVSIRGAAGSDASVTTENIATALGYTPASESKAETWTFTLEDGSTVTKKVVLS